MAYATGATLDAPDLQTREAYLKLQTGGRMDRKDYRRLANRMSVEEENARTGGTAKGSLPRATDPAQAYYAGQASVRPMAPVARATPAPAAPAAPAPQPRPMAPQPGSPRLFSRPLFAGESGVLGGNLIEGGQVQRVSPLQPSAVARSPQMAQVPSARITPPGREQSNPMTGTAPTIPQGATQDISAMNPNVYFGGNGAYRQQFRSPESAQIYDGYVRRLMQSAQPTTPDATAHVVAPVAPTAPASTPAVPRPKTSPNAPTLAGAQAGNRPTMGSWKSFENIGRRLFDAIVPATDAVGTPLRRLSQQPSPRVDNPQRKRNVAAADYP